MGDLPLLCVKKWFEALTGEFLPFVVSYISHFVCLYNPNYYFRPLSGPSIILIIFQTPFEIYETTNGSFKRHYMSIHSKFYVTKTF